MSRPRNTDFARLKVSTSGQKYTRIFTKAPLSPKEIREAEGPFFNPEWVSACEPKAPLMDAFAIRRARIKAVRENDRISLRNLAEVVPLIVRSASSSSKNIDAEAIEKLIAPVKALLLKGEKAEALLLFEKQSATAPERLLGKLFSAFSRVLSSVKND